MKGVFIGEYEYKKYTPSQLVNLLQKYHFDEVYLRATETSYEILELLNNTKLFKIFLWLDFKTDLYWNEDDIILKIRSGLVQGVVLDHIREDTYTLWNVLRIYPLCKRIADFKRKVGLSQITWYGCFKCEDYTNFFANEMNRLRYAQHLGSLKSFFSKCLMMSYHQEYRITIAKAMSIVRELMVEYGADTIVPIFQTYQDTPSANYNIYWGEVVDMSKTFNQKTYYRLGTCDPASFN